MRPIVVSALLALSAPLHAGILTVGPAGSGAQFSEIQAAIDAAQDNDVVLVQPGTYGAIVVAKPLRILGDGTGLVRVDAGAKVQGIAAGKEVVLAGLAVEGPASLVANIGVWVTDCAGTVILHDLTATGAHAAIQVSSSARTLVLACDATGGIQGTGALRAFGAGLWIADSTVVGADGATGLPGSRGLDLYGSSVHVWRSTLAGGTGGGSPFDPSFCVSSQGGAALFASGSSVTLYGGPGASVQGGDGEYCFGAYAYGGAGVELGGGSTALIQSDIPIAAGGPHSFPLPIEADASSSFALDPTVYPTLVASADQVATGGSITLTVEGQDGGIQLLFLSVATGPTLALPGVGGLGLLDTTQLLFVGTAVLAATTQVDIAIPIPPVPSLLGTTGFLQTLEAFGPSFALAFSNPVVAPVTQ